MALDLVQRYKAPDLAVEVDSGARTILPGTNVTFSTDPVTGVITINVPGALGGNVVGPASSVDNRVATFNGATGKIIKDSGVLISSLATTASLGNYVLKAGDTMTGQLQMLGTGSGGHIRMRSSVTANASANFDIGQNPTGAAGDNNSYLVNRVGGIDYYTANVFRGTMASSGTLQWNYNVIVSGADLYSYRSGGTTGVIFLNQAGDRYLYYDGTKYILNAAKLEVGGAIDSGGTITANTLGSTPVKIGVWTGSPSYGMFGWSGMTGNEYAILSGSADSNTYISTRTGGEVHIRPNANGTAGEVAITATGMTLNPSTAGSRKLSRIILGTAAPGVLADGELYLRY